MGVVGGGGGVEMDGFVDFFNFNGTKSQRKALIEQNRNHARGPRCSL